MERSVRLGQKPNEKAISYFYFASLRSSSLLCLICLKIKSHREVKIYPKDSNSCFIDLVAPPTQLLRSPTLFNIALVVRYFGLANLLFAIALITNAAMPSTQVLGT